MVDWDLVCLKMIHSVDVAGVADVVEVQVSLMKALVMEIGADCFEVVDTDDNTVVDGVVEDAMTMLLDQCCPS